MRVNLSVAQNGSWWFSGFHKEGVKMQDHLMVGIVQSLMVGAGRKRDALCYAGRKISLRRIRREVERCARAFLRWGFKPGAEVLLCAGQTPELLYTLFAVWKLGGSVRLLNPCWPIERLRSMITPSEGALLLFSEQYAGTMQAAFARAENLQAVLIPLKESLPIRRRGRVLKEFALNQTDQVLPRCILWKEFLESGRKRCALPQSKNLPGQCAIGWNEADAVSFGHSLTQGEVQELLSIYQKSFAMRQGGECALSLIPTWQPEGILGLLLPLFLGQMLLLEPRDANGKGLFSATQERADYILINQEQCSSGRLSEQLGADRFVALRAVCLLERKRGQLSSAERTALLAAAREQAYRLWIV